MTIINFYFLGFVSYHIIRKKDKKNATKMLIFIIHIFPSINNEIFEIKFLNIIFIKINL